MDVMVVLILFSKLYNTCDIGTLTDGEVEFEIRPYLKQTNNSWTGGSKERGGGELLH